MGVDRRLPTWLLVGTLWLLWGSSFLAIKIGTEHASPYDFVALRVAVSVVLLAVVVGIRDSVDEENARRALRYGLGLAALNVAAYLPLQTVGISLSDVGISAILIYAEPLIVAVLARYFLHERLRVTQVVGLVLGWLGVCVAALSGVETGAAPLVGVLFLLLGASSWAGGTILVKAVPSGTDIWRLLFWQNTFALPVVGAIALLTGGTIIWEAPLVGSMLFVGGLTGVGGFALLFTLLRRGEASIVSSWIFAVPIVSSILGVIVRNESFTGSLALGAAMVGVGIYLVSAPTPRRDMPDAPEADLDSTDVQAFRAER